ncbi:hypothetical protein ABZW50_19365 [Streptomyces bacillaris]
MCPHCNTRPEDWDHGGPDEEDAYEATAQRCVGCQVIADKQAELQRNGVDIHGLKVGLIHVSVAAALRAQREHTAGHRHRTTDND